MVCGKRNGPPFWRGLAPSSPPAAYDSHISQHVQCTTHSQLLLLELSMSSTSSKRTQQTDKGVYPSRNTPDPPACTDRSSSPDPLDVIEESPKHTRSPQSVMTPVQLQDITKVTHRDLSEGEEELDSTRQRKKRRMIVSEGFEGGGTQRLAVNKQSSAQGGGPTRLSVEGSFDSSTLPQDDETDEEQYIEDPSNRSPVLSSANSASSHYTIGHTQQAFATPGPARDQSPPAAAAAIPPNLSAGLQSPQDTSYTVTALASPKEEECPPPGLGAGATKETSDLPTSLESAAIEGDDPKFPEVYRKEPIGTVHTSTPGVIDPSSLSSASRRLDIHTGEEDDDNEDPGDDTLVHEEEQDTAGKNKDLTQEVELAEDHIKDKLKRAGSSTPLSPVIAVTEECPRIDEEPFASADNAELDIPIYGSIPTANHFLQDGMQQESVPAPALHQEIVRGESEDLDIPLSLAIPAMATTIAVEAVQSIAHMAEGLSTSSDLVMTSHEAGGIPSSMEEDIPHPSNQMDEDGEEEIDVDAESAASIEGGVSSPAFGTPRPKSEAKSTKAKTSGKLSGKLKKGTGNTGKGKSKTGSLASNAGAKPVKKKSKVIFQRFGIPFLG
jgi:hypothetical protein